MKRYLFLMMIAFGYAPIVQATDDDECGMTNTTFNIGEEVSYDVYYNWKSVWVGAGTVDFSVTPATINGKPSLHLKGVGKTYRTYDWFYKVRDVYESYIDPATLLPQKFVRDVYEGGYTIYNNYQFDRQKNVAVAKREDFKSSMRTDTFKIPSCTQDVLSAIYYMRVIDFSKRKPNEVIPIQVFLDDKIYDINVRYLGKERITVNKKTYDCIKFSPQLIAGTIFEEGADMKVWVTDDKNKVPVLVEAPIVVGSVKAVLNDYKGLRYDMTARVNK